MEEVDSIILHFLRDLDIHIADQTKQLNELPVDTIITAVSKCLGKINPSLKLPKKVPQGISHRIEVAAMLASMCKDMGYKNEVGYQTFLYYNEADLRQVFMFLIEHLPSEGNQKVQSLDLCDKKTLLYKNISRKIDEDLNAIWIPHCCNSANKNKVGDFFHTVSSENIKPVITERDSIMLIEQLLKTRQIKLKSSTKTDTINETLQIDKDKDILEPIIIVTSKTLKELKEEVINLRQKLHVLENERAVATMEFAKIQKSCEKAEGELNSTQNILRNIDVNIDDGVDTVLQKIKKVVNSLHAKSEELTSKHLSLKTEIETIKMNLPQSQRSDCKKSLLLLKETAKSLKDEYNNKEELREKLKREFAKLSHGSKRSIYTKRILEIISNVDKQNFEIKKILQDTRDLQKEINTLEGQLDRCFSVADETLYKDAKKDDQAKKAYKLLALLHSECNTIVTLVNNTGSVAREIIDLEDHVKTETAKQTEETLKRIQIDLSKIQEES